MGHHDVGRVHELGHVNARKIRAVLDDGRALAKQRRNDRLKRLRQNDVAHGGKEAKALALRRLKLAARNRVEAAAHNLGHNSAGEQRKSDGRNHNVQTLHRKVDKQDPQQVWRAAEQLDIGAHQNTERAGRIAFNERQHRAKDEREKDRQRRDLDRLNKAAPNVEQVGRVEDFHALGLLYVVEPQLGQAHTARTLL